VNYYNEIDPFCIRWLGNLAAASHVAAGFIDARSIADVQPDDVRQYRQAHFFAGVGGWPLALQLAGWPADAALWTGSCPCQPLSCAGKRRGHADERHLWPAWFRLIRECCPPVIFGEQVASKDGLEWLDGVFADLEDAGYACGATDLCAAGVGAPHIRQRLYWLANATDPRHTGTRQRAGTDGNWENPLSQRGFSLAESAGGCAVDRLGITNGERSQSRSAASKADGHGSTIEPTSIGSDGMGDTNIENVSTISGQQMPCAGRDCFGGDRLGSMAINKRFKSDQGDPGSGDTRSLPPSGGSNGKATRPGSPWSDFLIIPCRDDRSRRISAEPGDGPLVAGIPRKLGPKFAGLDRMGIRTARANRVGRLKGYGNAIVPQVAAEFVRAVMELQNC